MNTILRTLLLFVLVSCNIIGYAQFKIPNGYKELLESPASGKPMKRLSVQLDNDEVKDLATIIVNSKNNVFDVRLMVYLTQSNEYHTLNLSSLEDAAVHVFPLKVKNKVIECGYILDGTGANVRVLKLRYDSLSSKLQLVGFDSGYKLYSAFGGYCSKSYNLLTGEYWVKNQTYEYSAAKEETTSHTTTKSGVKASPKIYIEVISKKMLEELERVGSEFEVKDE